MHRNCAYENRAREIACGDEPSLREAGGRFDVYGICAQGGDVEEEGDGLLDVGEEEVVDEEEELVECWFCGGPAAAGKGELPAEEAVGEEKEERGAAEEGEETEC
jgi:hypothetical protein